MNFSSNLQRLRKENHLSQEKLAELLHVSRQAVSKWETGDGLPELDKIIQISELFNISLDVLLKEDLYAQSVKQTIFLDPDPLFEEMKQYLIIKKKCAHQLALAVMIIVVSLVFPILLSETRYSDFSAGIMLILIGIGASMIIIASLNTSNYQKPLGHLSKNNQYYFMAEFDGFKPIFSKQIAFGVFCCIIAIAIVPMSEILFHSENIGAALMFIIGALGIYPIITASIYYCALHSIIYHE